MYKLWGRLTSSQYRYVAVNLVVSLLTFGRNALFMSMLGLADLGQVAMMQTVVMLIGFLQGGMINGAFILYASKDRERNLRLIHMLFWGSLLILAVVVIFLLAGGAALITSAIHPVTLAIGMCSGVASLMSTWMNNFFVAEGSLRKSNIVGLISISVSLIVALSSGSFGLKAALISIFLQPLSMILVSCSLERRFFPSLVNVDVSLVRQVFCLGRLPFLSGLLVLLSYQIERWAIVISLGSESLGQYYLVMMYMAFFILIPASLMNFHLPNAIRTYEKKEIKKFTSIVNVHFIEIAVYCGVAFILTVTCMPFFVNYFFPQFANSVHLVYLIFPAMGLFVMRDSAALVLYSIKEMRPVLVAAALFMSFYFVLTVVAVFVGRYSLEVAVILRGMSILIPTIYLYLVRLKIMKRCL